MKKLSIHREANATLLGTKIIVTYDNIKRGPTLYATTGRDNAQCMTVEGKDEPAFAVIDVKLRYIKDR